MAVLSGLKGHDLRDMIVLKVLRDVTVLKGLKVRDGTEGVNLLIIFNSLVNIHI